MAKTQVTFKVDGFADREVAGFEYSFIQAVDKENQPAGIPRGGTIIIKCKARNDGNSELLQWMLAKSMKKGGKLVIMQSNDAEKEMKNIEFKDAYCVSFTETWDDKTNNAELAHIEKITISCKDIRNSKGGEYQNEWA